MKSKKIVILIICLLLTGCKEKTYKVNFETLGGSIIESVTIKKGEILTNLESPTKEGYLFVNWLKDGIEFNILNPINEDITLTANWTEAPIVKKEHTISFVTEKYTEKVMVEDNAKVTPKSAPKKEDYTFLGWFVGDELYNFDEPVTKDIILTAKYKLDKVTVTYDLDGGLGLALQTVSKNKTPSIPPTPTKEGYRFLKWTLNDKEFSFTEKVKEDIILKAVWEKIEYVTITLDTDGGTSYPNMIVEKYSKINKLPTPTKEGYVFIEWQMNNQKLEEDMVIKNDITLKAIYQLNEE